MRSFLLVVIAWLLCWLAPVLAWSQQLQCDPCSYHFGHVPVGNPKSYSIQLSNTGCKTLKITSTSEQGSAFSIGNFPLPVKIRPGSYVELPIIFTPAAKGWNHGTLTLVSNATDPQLTISLAGTGVASAQLGVSPATLNFGNVTVGSSANLQATLTASNGDVDISRDGSTSSEFAILGLTLPATIPAGQSIQVTIQFTPNASGTASGQAGFISDAADSPTVEQLTGTGVAQSSHSVNLSWDPGDGNAVGYNVYRGTAQAGPFQEINTALDASANYTDYTVVSGSTYYYVATEVNAQNQESAYSNIAEAVIPNP
jgi:hypothetical protein